MSWLGSWFFAALLLLEIVMSKDFFKQIWEGFTTRKEDLEVNWEELKKAENKLKKQREKNEKTNIF